MLLASASLVLHLSWVLHTPYQAREGACSVIDTDLRHCKENELKALMKTKLSQLTLHWNRRTISGWEPLTAHIVH